MYVWIWVFSYLKSRVFTLSFVLRSVGRSGPCYSSQLQVAHKALPASEQSRELQASQKHLTLMLISPTCLDSFRSHILAFLPCSSARRTLRSDRPRSFTLSIFLKVTRMVHSPIPLVLI